MLRFIAGLLLFLGTSFLLASGDCVADVIYTNDGKVVFGLVESESDSHVFFQQRLGVEGQYQQRIFARSEIRRLLVTVDQERLVRLSPGDWNAYRDWAEELSIQSLDPEARDLALRLYLIVARHADEPLRTAGFRGAIQVTGDSTPSSGTRQRRVRVLAFQTYPDDPSWSMSAGDAVEPLPTASAEVQLRLGELAAELRRFRLGMPNSLEQLIREDLTREAIELMPTVCTWSQFSELASRKEADYAAIARLLNLELAILSLIDGVPPEPLKRDSPWSVLVNQDHMPVELVNFDNVSSFDLEATVFRNGAWNTPQ